jgi:Protein of unknown function (DUF2914)
MRDAEHYFRRGYAVASSLLDPRHPLVVTSLANLEAFCDAQGLPLDDWPDIGAAPTRPPGQTSTPRVSAAVDAHAPPVPGSRASAAAAVPEPDARQPQAAQAATRITSASRGHAATASVPTRRASTARGVPRGVVWSLAVMALAATMAVAWLWLLPVDAPRPTPAPTTGEVTGTPVPNAPASQSASGARIGPSAPNTSPAPIASAAPAAAATPATPAAPAAPEASVARVEPPAVSAAARPAVQPTQETAETSLPTTSSPPTRTPVPPDRPSGAVADPTPRVVGASVCERLVTGAGAWTCESIDGVTAARSATYMTRVAVARAERVEHRWFEGDRLRATRRLSVGASPGAGYRTFSRQALTPGRWRVELRSEDGTILHSASFEVR